MAIRNNNLSSRKIYIGTNTEAIPNDGDALISGNVGIGTTDPTYKFEVSNGTQTGTFNPNSSGFMFLGSTSNHPLYFGVNDSTKMIINTSGNVGIGTTSPSSKLQVSGEAYVTGAFGQGVSIANKITNYGAEFRTSGASAQVFFGRSGNNIGSGAIGADASYVFIVWKPTDFSTPFVIEQGGNVGIGTTGPDSKLEIAGDTSNPLLTLKSYSGGSKDAFMRFYDASGGSTYSMGLDSSNGKFKIAYDADGDSLTSGTRLVMDTFGNVGIGTVSPSEKLEVNGNAILDASNARLKIKGGVTGTNSGIDWTFNSDSTQYAKIELDYDDRGTTGFLIDSGYPMTLDYSSGRFSINRNGSNELTILNGNVGIGATTPGEKLTVSGNGRFSNGSQGTLTIKHNYGYLQPNWGIKLDGDTNTSGGYLSQYVNIGGFALNQGGTYYGGGPHRTDANSTSFSSVSGVNGEITFHTNTSLTASTNFVPSERMRITSSGNVGIGTNAPNAKLEVDYATYSANNAVANFVNGNNPVRVAYDTVVVSQQDVPCLSIIETPDGSQASEQKLTFSAGDGRAVIGSSSTATDGIYINTNRATNAPGYNPSLGTNVARFLNNGNAIFPGNVGIGTTSTAASAKLNVMGNQTFGLPGNGSNTNGRFISIEGNADSAGEGSGRIFFTEHNSTTASMDKYGMSIGYRGGSTTITGASGNDWSGLSQVGNGQWGMWGHNNSADGALIMYGDRSATFINFAGNDLTGVGSLYVNRAISSYAVNIGNTDVRAGLKVISSTNDDSQLTFSQGVSGSQLLQASNQAGTAGKNIFLNPFGGNVGIGTTSAANKLQVAGTIYGNGGIIGSSDLLLQDTASAYSTELKMQNNTHTIGIDYQNNETLRFITRSAATTVPITFQMRAGTITANNFILDSDKRIKSNIKDLSSDNIDVRWRSFEMKDNEGEYRTGVIAQELEENHPEFVNTNDEGFKSVKYIDLLIAKIAELENRIKQLEK